MDRLPSPVGRLLKCLALALACTGSVAAQEAPPVVTPWSPVVKIGTDLPTCWAADTAQMAVDPAGNAFAVWLHDTASVKVSRFDAARGAWSVPVQLSGGPAGPTLRLSPPSIDVDDLGNAVVAWVQQNTASPSYSVVWAARYLSAQEVWAGAQVVSHMDGSLAHSPQVALRGGRAALAWVRDDSPFGLADSVWWSRLFSGQTTWSVPDRIDDPRAPEGKVTGLRLALGGSEQAALVWSKSGTRYPGVPVIWANLASIYGGGFPEIISNHWLDPETAPQVVIEFGGRVRVAWQQSGPGLGGDSFRNIWTVQRGTFEPWGTRRLVSGLYDKTSSLRLASFNKLLGMRGTAIGWIEPGTPGRVWAAHLALDEMEPRQLVATGNFAIADTLALAADRQGNVQAAWSDGQNVRAAALYRRSTNRWSLPVVLESSSFGVTPNGPMAVNFAGVTFTGYGVRTGPGLSGCYLAGRRHD